MDYSARKAGIQYDLTKGEANIVKEGFSQMKIIDMHCDTLGGAYRKPDEFNLFANDLNIDFQKMQKGDYMAQFFAMFLPPRAQAKERGHELPPDDVMIDMMQAALLREIGKHSDLIGFARNAADLQTNNKAGKMSAFLTIEDGRPVEGSFDRLQHYYDLGVRLISFTWNYANCFGFPNSLDAAVMNKGLTAFGCEAVEWMNDKGMLVDVSHLSDGGFFDVARLSKKPFVASHSNCRALSGHQRNLTDEMIPLLAKSGGVSGINFCSNFLSADISSKDSLVSDMVRHIQHFVQLGGIECVGLGSDFDGITSNLEVKDASKMQIIFDALGKAGFSEAQIEKIAYGNVLRVIKEVLK